MKQGQLLGITNDQQITVLQHKQQYIAAAAATHK
jgi:hypothetical protein